MHRNLRRTITFVLVLVMILAMLPLGIAEAAALKKGSKGDEVKYLQQNLAGLGYLDGEADGSFGSVTEVAVQNFQNAYGLAADGSAGYATQTALRNAIVRLQVELIRAGFAPGSADGHFGSKTQKALKEYQRSRGLQVTGVADAETWAKINSEAGGMRGGAAIAKGSSGTQVKYLQMALIGLGYLTDAADGKYGAITTEAVRAYQDAYGLSVDGSAGPKTMTSLRNCISALQSDLSRKGWYGNAIDGVYGNGTKAAVKSYQQYVGISGTGVAGPRTMEKLYGYSLGGSEGEAVKTYRTQVAPIYQSGDYRVIWTNANKTIVRTVATSGCAGACIAMAFNALKNTDAYDGYSVMKWYVDNGYYWGEGTDHDGLFDYPRQVGLNAVSCRTSSEMIEHLKMNRLAIILVKDMTGDEMFTHSRSNGHYVLVSGYRVKNGVKQVYVNNPLSNRHNGWCDLSDLMANAKDRSIAILYK